MFSLTPQSDGSGMKRRSLRLNGGVYPHPLGWLWKFLLKPSDWLLSAGDEAQVNLALVQGSSKDWGVYRCTITNEYGSDSTNCLLSAESLYFTFTFHFKTPSD